MSTGSRKIQNNGRTATLLKDTLWFAIGNFGSKIITLLLVPLYTNVLTTGEYGTADIINTTVSLAVPVFTLSINDAVFRFAMEKSKEPREVLNSSLFVLALSPIALCLFYPLICRVLPNIVEFWLFFVLTFILNALADLFGNYLKAVGQTKLFAYKGIVQTLVYATSNIILLLVLKMGLRGYLISSLLGSATAILFMIAKSKLYRAFSLADIKKPLLSEMLRYCIPLIPASVAWWIMASIDKYMLLYMCGSEATGLYSVAHKIPTIVSTFITFFVNSWQIAAVKGVEETDNAEYTSSLYNRILAFGVIGTGLLVTFSRPIGSVLFKKDFFMAWTMSPSLCVSTLFSSLSMILGAQFTAYKRSDLHLISNLLAVVSNICFNLVCISILGVNGAAVGTMMSFFVLLVYREIKVKQLMQVSYRVHNYFAYIVLVICGVYIAITTSFATALSMISFMVLLVVYRKELKSIVLEIGYYVKKTFKKGE